jgi:predicted acyltransferase
MRLASLDSFRGLAIAGMILVNNPGSWSHVYAPLRHAEWHGFTPTDQIFPAFLFIVGAAIPFTLARYRETAAQDRSAFHQRLIRRVAVLFALGLVLNASTTVLEWAINGAPLDLSTLRIMGVLQRISLAYLLAVLLVLACAPRLQVLVVGLVLLAYWAALALIPVPGHGPGVLTPEGSLPGYIDRLVLTPAHLYQGWFDPEGLLSTLPAAASVMFGVAAGAWVKNAAVSSRVTLGLVAAGLVCLLLGALWGLVLPINKQLWTSSYVVFTAGGSLVLLGLCYEVMEVRRWSWLGWPFQVMGVNAITLFFASGIVARLLSVVHAADGRSLQLWIFEELFVPWAGQVDGSLAFALATVLVWWLVLYGLYRRGVIIRL